MCVYTYIYIYIYVYKINHDTTNKHYNNDDGDNHNKAVEKGRTAYALQGLFDVDVFVLFLQSGVLFFLWLGQMHQLPEQMCAFFCIVICAVTMLYMNIATFQKHIKDLVSEQQENVASLVGTFHAYKVQVLYFLAGENPLGIQFIDFEGTTIESQKVESVNIMTILLLLLLLLLMIIMIILMILVINISN